MRGRLILPVAAASLIVVASPFIGEIRTAVERTFPGQYLALVLAAIVMPAVLAAALALVRIRDRRPLRYGLLAAAAAIATVYATVMQTTRTEQFHFTEYGVLTLLFYRAWRARGDASAIVLPICASVVTGFVDEGFQWFVPSRVGEMRDVVLNGVGITCGVLVGVALAPPERTAAPVPTKSRRPLAVAASGVIAAAALFLQLVHLGYEIRHSEAGTFRTRFDPAALGRVSTERAERWRRDRPAPQPLISREDHYLSEALFHVQWRNQMASTGDHWSAWKENLILENFYAPVLEWGSPESKWPADQRDAMEAAAAKDAGSYVSAAYPFPIYDWNRTWFWGGVIAVVSLVWWACR